LYRKVIAIDEEKTIMIIAFIGSGGKTTRIKKLAKKYYNEGKKVLICTSTHMSVEPDTLITDDPVKIIEQLEMTGYVIAGRAAKNHKIQALSEDTYQAVCPYADIVLIEADGSKRMPVKYPNDTEPVIYDNVDEIQLIVGLQAAGHPAKEVCHRLELLQKIYPIEDDTILTYRHIQDILRLGYRPVKEKYKDKKFSIHPTHNGSLYEKEIARKIAKDQDITESITLL
jgi:xanthine dehydrogenase accessory factor